MDLNELEKYNFFHMTSAEDTHLICCFHHCATSLNQDSLTFYSEDKYFPICRITFQLDQLHIDQCVLDEELDLLQVTYQGQYKYDLYAHKKLEKN